MCYNDDGTILEKITAEEPVDYRLGGVQIEGGKNIIEEQCSSRRIDGAG